ncbi:MAG TPA: xanthine dehydrogenase family protein molybdopterin-binding subunit [Acetobacteraceae bacterium]|jgi:aerobic carbon-monoxide dehydrogenase large subunit|nr:xanthine dehydrogenase family protein molybdopterin-binding subunit [Acetobacteraceae bacterium]
MDRVGLPQADAERLRKLRGQGRYTADERFEGSAYAVFVRSPHAHARVVSVDTTEAAGMSGVVRILTGADCEGLGNFPVIDRVGTGLAIPFRPVLASDIVRHPGEAVACVIAETQAQALDAAEAVMVDYDALPAAVGLAEDAPLVHPGAPGNVAMRHEAGDAEAVDAAMKAAALVVETEIHMPRLAPVTLEPRAAAARFDDGVFFIRAPHQGVNEMRRDFAGVFNLPQDRFHVMGGEVGGGFGPRNIAYPEYAAVMLAAKLTGRPVLWHGTRGESFLTDIQGRGVRVRGRLAVDAAGRFTALSMQYDADLGAYISPVAVFANVNNPLQSLIGCYDIPAAHAVFRMMHTHAVPTGPYRGAGRPEMALLIERMVDIAARRLNMDPFALRQRNIIPAEAFPFTLPNGPRYDSGDFDRLMRVAREASDWDGFAAREAASPGVRLGRGVALFIEVSGGGGAPDEAALTLSVVDGQAALRIETVTASTGQSHPRTFALVAGPRLGLPEIAVDFVASDPGTGLSGAGSYASRSTIAAGSAVAAAADALSLRLRGMAALRANCAPEDLHLADEAVCRTDGSPVCRLVDLLGEPMTETGRVAPTQAFASGCHIAEVAIDEATGAAVLTRYLAVDDAGVTIDHQAAEAQIQGGVAQGVGEVLGEEAVIDAESGQPYAASLMDYMLPRANDFPPYRVLECNTPSPFNPLGVKGIGEAGTTGALCAVTSAIADALGGRDLPAMPFTQERLWRALQR